MTIVNQMTIKPLFKQLDARNISLTKTFSRKNIYSATIVSALFSLASLPAHAEYEGFIEQPSTNGSESSENVIQSPLSAKDSKDGIIALVNDTPILKSDLIDAITTTQSRIRAAGEPVPSSTQIQNDVLNTLILRELQLNLAQRAGIRPEPEAINQSLARIAQSQGLNSLTQLQQKLDSRKPGSYAKLRSNIIKEESLKILQQSQISKRVNITEQDIDAYLESPEGQRLSNTEYHTIHMRVPFSDDYSRITDSEKAEAIKIAEQIKILFESSNDAQSILEETSSGIAKNYIAPIQGGDMGFHPTSGLPTEVASNITDLPVGQVTEPQITPQGIDVIKLVDKRSNQNMIVPQWKVRHILIESNATTNDSIAEQKIEDIYNQLLRNEDFASIASTYSDDPGSAGRGGDLDWVTEGQMVPSFEEMMKQTAVGDISKPFKSQYGWHILKVEGKRQQDMSEQIKRQLANEALYQRLAVQAQEDWLQELRANAFVRIID